MRSFFALLPCLLLWLRCRRRFGLRLITVRFFRTYFVLVQASRARGIGQSLYAAVIEITTAIENDGVDAFRERAFGNRLADAPRGFDVSTRTGAQILFGRRSGDDRLPALI